MTVGTAARRAGVKIDTIRFYERRALLPKSPRTEAGFRTFNQGDGPTSALHQARSGVGLYAERDQAAPRPPPHPWQDVCRCPKPHRSEDSREMGDHRHKHSRYCRKKLQDIPFGWVRSFHRMSSSFRFSRNEHLLTGPSDLQAETSCCSALFMSWSENVRTHLSASIVRTISPERGRL